jgi:hypothetical protein
MDDRLGYGQLCRVIKDVNSEIRQGRKESIGRKPVPRKVGFLPRARAFLRMRESSGRRARMRKSPPTQTHAQPAIVFLSIFPEKALVSAPQNVRCRDVGRASVRGRRKNGR